METIHCICSPSLSAWAGGYRRSLAADFTFSSPATVGTDLGLLVRDRPTKLFSSTLFRQRNPCLGEEEPRDAQDERALSPLFGDELGINVRSCPVCTNGEHLGRELEEFDRTGNNRPRDAEDMGQHVNPSFPQRLKTSQTKRQQRIWQHQPTQNYHPHHPIRQQI